MQSADYFPCISAAAFEFTPQKYIWQLCIALYCTPRYLLGICCHHFYASGSHDVAVKRHVYVVLVYVMTGAYISEISSVVFISFAAAPDSCE